MEPGSTTRASSERTLRTDGGESEASDEAADEGDTTDDQSDGTEEGGATNVLYLDLEGLFLNLLGLEVDLDEVELEVEAVTGQGNLLGNLLSAVAGLLDKGAGGLRQLLSRVLGLGGDGSIFKRLSDGIRSSLRDAVDDIPVEKLLTQLITGLVNQLLDREEQQEGEASDSSGETPEAQT